jgi:hypothetical protein
MSSEKSDTPKVSTQELIGWIKKAGESERVLEFQYPFARDLYFQVAYASKHVLQQIREECKESVFNPRTRQPEERLNEDKMRRSYARLIIHGWRGLTLSKLQRIVPGVVPDREGVDPETEIRYDEDLAAVLIQYSIEFENWVIDTATNVENFTTVALKKKEQYENLG